LKQRGGQWYRSAREPSPVKTPASKPLYLIPVLSKALDVLELLQQETDAQSLEVIYGKTKISKTTVYRILKTLAHRGYVSQLPNGRYRAVSLPKKSRFGFGSESAEMPFSADVTESLKTAAAAAGVELVVLDNRYDAFAAVRNAEEFVRQRVDLVIEFQIDQNVAPVIADRIHSAGIPLIAVDIPHPHATFFGVDNFRVGFEAGECLALHARRKWDSHVSWVLGLDIAGAGPLVQSRITGAFAAIRSLLPRLPVDRFVLADGKGLRDASYRITLEFLRAHAKDHGIAIAAATDTSALGALEAVHKLKREGEVAIVGQDCIREAMAQMRIPGSPLIGSVSHEAATYGPRLIQLGLAMLRGETVAPYNYVQHRLVTASSSARRARAG
jgi:ribose transport system substrate-binding protein